MYQTRDLLKFTTKGVWGVNLQDAIDGNLTHMDKAALSAVGVEAQKNTICVNVNAQPSVHRSRF
jgi:hypothetical protein